MRKETRKICSAFIKGVPARAARSHTDGRTLFLHYHPIAEFARVNEDGTRNDNILSVSFCGYPTPTTKDRLNGLFDLLGFGRPFFTKKNQLYFGSKLRPVDDREVMTFDLREMRQTIDDANDNTPFHHHTIAA
jgi:hypothetical protein